MVCPEHALISKIYQVWASVSVEKWLRIIVVTLLVKEELLKAQ